MGFRQTIIRLKVLGQTLGLYPSFGNEIPTPVTPTGITWDQGVTWDAGIYWI